MPKMMIELSDEDYKIFKNQRVGKATPRDRLFVAVKNGIILPDNVSNGDILCAIFPDMHYTLSEKSPRVVTTIGIASSFDIDWWNSPYKRGGEND